MTSKGLFFFWHFADLLSIQELVLSEILWQPGGVIKKKEEEEENELQINADDDAITCLSLFISPPANNAPSGQ